jgi:E3 ubiquitin-protein ligase HUWE1
MSILDDILYAFLPSLDIFRSINGLTALVLRIGVEIDYCLEIGKEFQPDEFLPKNIPDPGVSSKFRKLFSRTPLLRALMKLILHMMQSSGTADGMRNLIDSSLPNSILKVFQNSRLFGSVGIFGLAINVMSTFVHNEPTSLAIQEAQLPSSFLESAKDVLPVSPEVKLCF